MSKDQLITTLRTRLPPVLYKYLNRDDLHYFTGMHSVRVGTLADYRDREERLRREGKPTLRSDSREGTGSFIERQPPGPQSYDEMTPFMQRGFGGPGGRPGGIGVFEDNTVVLASEVPDCHVYCTSLELSRPAAFLYDACVAITDPARFVAAVSRALGDTLGYQVRCDFGPVRYGPRAMPSTHHGKVRVAFLKLPYPFAVEKEFRIVWYSDAPPPVPYQDVTVPDLASMLNEVVIP